MQGFPDRSEPLITAPKERVDLHSCAAEDHDPVLCDIERSEAGDWMSGVFARCAIERDQMYVLRPYLPRDVIELRQWSHPKSALRKMSHA